MAYIPELRIVSKADACAFFEVSDSTIEAWERRGMPVLEKKRQGWKIDLLAACKWRFAPKDASTSSEEFDPDALAPKQRLEWYQGTKARIELELRQGQLVEAADAEQQMSVIIKSFVNFLETFVDILERDTGLTGAQVERAIELVDAQRESLSKTLKEAASAG